MPPSLLRIFRDLSAISAIWVAALSYFSDQGHWPSTIRIGRRQADQLFRSGVDFAVLRLNPGEPNAVTTVTTDSTLSPDEIVIDD